MIFLRGVNLGVSVAAHQVTVLQDAVNVIRQAQAALANTPSAYQAIANDAALQAAVAAGGYTDFPGSRTGPQVAQYLAVISGAVSSRLSAAQLQVQAETAAAAPPTPPPTTGWSTGKKVAVGVGVVGGLIGIGALIAKAVR